MRILEELVNYILENIKPYPGNIEVAENTSYLVRLIKKFDKENNNGWIPVSERLPEQYKRVLVTNGDEFHPIYFVASFIGNEWRLSWDFDKVNYIKVIAWQPLPESYKEKSEK